MSTSPTPRSGLDLAWMNDAVRPQDDLFAHVNGKWLDSHVIPDDRASDGAFRTLRDQSEVDVQAIIENAASLEGPEATSIANLYASFMDEARIEALGATPVQPLIEQISAVSDLDALATLLGEAERYGRAAIIGGYVNTDAKDTSRYLVYLTQTGLGLPDESYYSDDAYADMREKYVAHVAKMASLFGIDNAESFAATVMDLETAIAALSWDRVTNRDAEKTYNKFDRDGLRALAPGFAWDNILAGMGAPADAYDEVVVRQPSFVEGIAALWTTRPIQDWKAWLTWHTISSSAAYLNDEIVQENFAFYGRTLSGTPEVRERWRRGVSLVEGVLGDAVGKLYAEKHFPAAYKARMVELVDNLIEAYRQSILQLDWMGADTRERALVKLGQFTPKIGYPENWKDYSTLELQADDLLGNVARASAWGTAYHLAKLGGPVDRTEWFMTPQTVNAYYNPLMNEIVFPAAILQPPFFDADADDAANYGGIGAVIGHEIGHGFDDQGSRYDGTGNLTDWWEERDREEFTRRAQALIDQYNELSPLGLDDKINGALTVGENIGDLGGLTIALKAYEISLGGADAPVIDGLTGIQRVFFGWAQVWRGKARPEEAQRLLSIDPHSPANQRCNGIIANLDSFHEAFAVTEGDALFKPREERVRIW